MTDQWEMICRAQETASHCGQCGKPIAKVDPVWRKRLSFGYGHCGGGWRASIVRGGVDCSQTDAHPPSLRSWLHGGPPRAVFFDPVPCEGCERSVHHQIDCTRHRRTFCCQTCKESVRIAEA